MKRLNTKDVHETQNSAWLGTFSVPPYFLQEQIEFINNVEWNYFWKGKVQRKFMMHRNIPPISLMGHLFLSNLSKDPLWRTQTCLPGDGIVEREDAQGDAELNLPRALCRHVLHPWGQHKVEQWTLNYSVEIRIWFTFFSRILNLDIDMQKYIA